MASPTGWTVQVACNLLRRGRRAAAAEHALLLRRGRADGVGAAVRDGGGEVWEAVRGSSVVTKRVRVTTDAGAHWTDVPSDQAVGRLYAISSTEAVGIVGDTSLYATGDGGRQWTRVDLPPK
jgi:hypothetical protein